MTELAKSTGIRSLRPADRPALLELWNRSLAFDPMTPELLEEKVWGDPAFDPETGLVWDEDGLQGFCLGVQRPAQQRAHIKLLAVAPERRRQGLGSSLLQAVESRLAGLPLPRGVPEIRVCESNPNYLQPGLDVRYTPAILFFESHSYQRLGETYNMECPLLGRDFSTVAEEAALPETEFRRAEAGDEPKVMAFLARHFPLWRDEVQVMLGNRPISLHLALRQGQLVGFAGFDGNNRHTGWFGPMGTDPERRGGGLGRVLLRRVLLDFQAQGRERCTIPWVGPYGFYARHCDAHIDRVFWRYRKVQPG